MVAFKGKLDEENEVVLYMSSLVSASGITSNNNNSFMRYQPIV
jgi:hypothetical protein